MANTFIVNLFFHRISARTGEWACVYVKWESKREREIEKVGIKTSVILMLSTILYTFNYAVYHIVICVRKWFETSFTYCIKHMNENGILYVDYVPGKYFNKTHQQQNTELSFSIDIICAFRHIVLLLLRLLVLFSLFFHYFFRSPKMKWMRNVDTAAVWKLLTNHLPSSGGWYVATENQINFDFNDTIKYAVNH